MFWKPSLSSHTKIEHCINIRDSDPFVFRSAWSGPSMKSSNQRLVVRRRPFRPPLTVTGFHVEVHFPNRSLSIVYNSHNTRFAFWPTCRVYNRRIFNKKQNLHSIVNYLLKLCAEIFLQNQYYIKIPHIIAPWWNGFHKYSKYHMTLSYSSCLINLRNQRLVVCRRPSGPPLTASRFHFEASFPNWSFPSVYDPDNSRFAYCQSCRIYNRGCYFIFTLWNKDKDDLYIYKIKINKIFIFIPFSERKGYRRLKYVKKL
jgi:hypothetical protein